MTRATRPRFQSAAVLLAALALTSVCGAAPAIHLPIELLGEAGTTESTVVTVAGEPADASHLWLKTHRLAWREDGEFASLANPRGTVRPGSKGSVRLNGGPWIPLTNETVTSEGMAGELGGLNGAYMTVSVRLPVAALASPGVQAGDNTLEFRFDSTDGISSGWRLLGVDVRTSGGVSLLSNPVVWDDPDTWRPPLDTPEDIAAGRTLWHTAPLTDLGFANTRHAIRSKCSSCHFRDGGDLVYFNYSNKSIIARSMFHGLSQVEAEQVTSYIRSVRVNLPAGTTLADAGRPWNPPYQPGPGLDAKPVELWAAGAGVDAALEDDTEMKEHLFPDGRYDPAILGVSGFLNPRETPQALQYPDWNAWLPTAGVEDLVDDPALLADSEIFKAFKKAEDWLIAHRWNQMPTDDWFMGVGLFYVQLFNEGRNRHGFPGEHWYTNRDQPDRTPALVLAQARHNLARSAWFNLRLFELITMYRLDNVTERSSAGGAPEVPAGYRSWGMPGRTVFETAPHFVSDHAGLSFNFTQPGNYLSTAWYSLEQIFNGGYRAGGFGIDWNYHPFHIMNTHYSAMGHYTDGPIHAYRAAWSLIWMYQTIPTLDRRKDPVVPWTPRSFGFSQRQLGLGLEVAFGTDELVEAGRMTVAEQRQLQEALALAFLGIAERYTPGDWVRRVADTDQYRSADTFETIDYAPSYNPRHAYDLPERGYQADAYYLRLKILKERRMLTLPTMKRLLIWGRGVWPKGAWDLLNIAPELSARIENQTASAGARVSFTAAADGFPDPVYQWHKDGVAIAGATASTFTLGSAQAGDAGRYTVVVSNSAGSITSEPASLTVTAAPAAASRPMNLSTRALVRSGGDALIPGFVISGTGTKRVLIRAVGPTLAAFGVVDPLADPRITLNRLNAGTGQYVTIADNDNWSTLADAGSITTTSAAVGAFALPPGSADAALLLDLAPGHYTALSTGDPAAPDGVAMVELYDADPANPTAHLTNISNRGYVGTGGHIMIPGFVISDEGPKTLLLRAVGPGLAPYGVANILADPRLTLFRTIPGTSSSEAILTNDDWDGLPGSATTAATAASVGAFSLPAGSKDAAMVATLQPGAYTIQASGVGETTGVTLVEIYVVP